MTHTQLKLLDFIRDFIAENRYSPSYDEMADGMGYASKSNIHRTVVLLRKHRKITMIPHTARSIEIVAEFKQEKET